MNYAHAFRAIDVSRSWIVIAAMIAVGCGAPGDGPPDPGGEDPGTDVGRDPRGPAELPPARAPERLTAQQIQASLTVATGQTWADFGEAAATLGRPDFTQTTEEGRQMSVAFETLVGDAARATCRAAVTADRALPVDSEERAILRGVDVAAPDAEARRANLRRLLLRFHGHDVVADDDPRVLPWLALLDAPLEPSDVRAGATPADVEAVRWEALCIGLAIHPDFLTY